MTKLVSRQAPLNREFRIVTSTLIPRCGILSSKERKEVQSPGEATVSRQVLGNNLIPPQCVSTELGVIKPYALPAVGQRTYQFTPPPFPGREPVCRLSSSLRKETLAPLLSSQHGWVCWVTAEPVVGMELPAGFHAAQGPCSWAF